MDNTKFTKNIDLTKRNDPVTPNKEEKKGMIRMTMKQPRIQNYQVIRKKKHRRNQWHHFLLKKTKEYIKTQKVTNTPNFISQLEPSSPKEIMLNAKLHTDVSIFSGVTLATIPPEKIETSVCILAFSIISFGDDGSN